jgi:single-strand DNA-binding protein
MANLNFNSVTLGGRLTAAPEIKQTQSGVPVVSFSIAVNRRAKAGEERVADFFNVTAWRQTAEFVHKYFNKGSSILVVGTLQNRSWTDQNGVKHYATDVIADEVTFVDSRGESAAAQADQAGFVPPAYTAPAEAPKFEEIKQDDDLPF